MLAVMRVIGKEPTDFREVLVEAHERINRTPAEDQERRYELIHAMFTYAYWKRPAGEREAIKAIAVGNPKNPVDQERMENMVQTIAEAYIEEGVAKGVAKGQLLANRETLRRLLTLRFGNVPKAVLEQIDSTTDLARLQNALDQVLQLKSLDELAL